MVAVAHVVVEVLPEPVVLSECSVSAAGNIAENSVESEVVLFVVDPQVGKESGIVLHHEEGRGVQASGLMS